MKVEKKDLPESRVELTVSLDKTEVPHYEKMAIEALAKEVKVAGFRKGKAPADVALPHIEPRLIAEKAIDFAVRATIMQAFDEVKLRPVQMPKVDLKDDGYKATEKIVYVATADVVPPIELGDYKKLKVEKPNFSVSTENVNEVVERIAMGYGEKKVVKRAAKLDDEIVLDFTGSVDGVEFPGGSAHDFVLLLGSNQFIPGFEDGCVGHEAGDRFDLPVTFPEDYSAPNLAGKKANFNVLIKQVTEIVKAKVDDELAEKCGFKDMKALRDDIRQNIERQGKAQLRHQLRDRVAGALVESSKVEAPTILVKDQYEQLRARHTQDAAARGLSLEDYVKMQGTTLGAWEEELKGIAEDHVKAQLCLGAVFEQEAIKIPDEVVDGQVKAFLEVYRKTPEAKRLRSDPSFRASIRHQMEMDAVLDFLVEVNGLL